MDSLHSPDTSHSPDCATRRTTNESYQTLLSALPKQQLQLIQTLKEAGDAGVSVLMDFLLHQKNTPTISMGAAYQALYAIQTPHTQEFLKAEFPEGIIELRSDRHIDYRSLQQALANQDFLVADKLTNEKLCELAGPAAIQRRWLYFTEVPQFPATDLQTINTLWLVHSEGKFGFSVQRELWISVGKNWEKLWAKIAWKSNNIWTRYPQEFQWNLAAPRGHLPLSNQLRGVRVIEALLTHPAWSHE